jgi:hypothetical protein
MIMVETDSITPYHSFLNYFQWNNEKDLNPNIPNEIFNDLTDSSISSYRHRAFAYSFYYLCTSLYFNAKYGSIPLRDLYSLQLIELLYGDRKPINYITKRNGVLDQIGYTTSENDFPIVCDVEDGCLVDFSMYSDLTKHQRDQIDVPSNFICKRPIKAFYRHKDDQEHTGTFFEIKNTHCVDFTIFARCMTSSKYGFENFYVYAFLFAFDKFINSKPNVYKSYIALSLSLSPKTLNRILSNLTKLNLLKVDETKSFRYIIRKTAINKK